MATLWKDIVEVVRQGRSFCPWIANLVSLLYFIVYTSLFLP